MMRSLPRRRFLAVTVTWTVAACNFAPPQPTPVPPVVRIGYLDTDVGGATSQPLGAFRDGLRTLGWIEGQNVAIEYRFAEGNEDRLPILAAELGALPLSVIVVTTTQG